MLDRDADPAPHSIELERLILGAVLIDPELRDNLRRLLRPHDFWREQHAAIWQAMLGER